jgi:hypothetical protein
VPRAGVRCDGPEARAGLMTPKKEDFYNYAVALLLEDMCMEPIKPTKADSGAIGGKAGTGASKRRGDSAYYRRLVSLRADRQKVLTERGRGA